MRKSFEEGRLVTLLALLVVAAVLGVLFGGSMSKAITSPSTGFEGFAPGDLNGQFGWTSGHGSSFCPLYDVAIVPNTYGYSSFETKSLRISNAVTCGSFNDQTFSPSLADEAGEASADTSVYSGGVRQPYFEAQWDFASAVPDHEQPGLAVVASPDRGDPGRMSWLQMQDTPSGLQLNFEDYQRSVSDIVLTPIATGLDRTVPHTVKITMQFVDGPSNDIVRIYLDGRLIHTGTSWEDYYRDWEVGVPHAVDSVMFRTSGTAVPANTGKGFLIDNFSEYSGPLPTADLTGITLSSGTLSPAFAPSTTAYTARVDNSVSSVTVDTASNGATALVTGGSSLSVGENTITITVTARDAATTKVYTITVIRAAPALPPVETVTEAPPTTTAPVETVTEVTPSPAAPAEPPTETASPPAAPEPGAPATATAIPGNPGTATVVLPTAATPTTGSLTTVAVDWSAAAFSAPATILITPIGQLGGKGPAGLPAGGFRLDEGGVQVQVLDSNGTSITTFSAPLVIHISASVPGDVVAWSNDAVSWTPIPRLATRALETGRPDGYFGDLGGPLDIYTRHSTYFGLVRDVQAPSSPVLEARLAGHTLRLNWHGAKDNVRVTGYRLAVDRRLTIPTGHTLQNLPAHVGRYQVVALDRAGNSSPLSKAITVVARTRPANLPRQIPGWGKPLLAWQQTPSRLQSDRPVAAPSLVPRWYWVWATWQDQPLRIAT